MVRLAYLNKKLDIDSALFKEDYQKLFGVKELTLLNFLIYAMEAPLANGDAKPEDVVKTFRIKNKLKSADDKTEFESGEIEHFKKKVCAAIRIEPLAGQICLWLENQEE